MLICKNNFESESSTLNYLYESSTSNMKLKSTKASIDLNRLRRYRALEFRQPVTQGKHSVKRSL